MTSNARLCWILLAAVVVVGICTARWTMAASADQAADLGTLVVANKLDDSIGFYDAETGAEQKLVPVGRKPHETALSQDGKEIFVSLYGLDTYSEQGEGGRAVAIVDVASRTKVGEIDLGKYRRPHGLDIGQRSGRVYVTCDHPAALLVLDPKTRTVVQAIELENPNAMPHMVRVTPDERRAFMADSGAEAVSVIDLAEQKEIKQISIGGVPMGMEVTADGATLFATNRTGDTVTVIDVPEAKVKRIIPLEGNPVRAFLTPDERWLLVGFIGSGDVALIDAQRYELVRRLPIGKRVEAVRVDPTGRFGYASAQEDNKVVKFSMSDWKPLLEIKTGQKPDPLILLP